MIEKRYIELINGELDGVNTLEQSRELKEYLDADPEARGYYEDLREMGEALGEVEEVEPPEGLRRAILSSVRAFAGEREGRGYFANFLDAFRPRPRPRYAYAFAAGVLVGFCLFAVASIVTLRGSTTGPDGLYGTLTGVHVAESIISSQCIPLDLPEVYGGACIEHARDAVLANLDLSAVEEIQIAFEYDDKVHFEGFRALSEGNHSMKVSGNRAELTHVGDCDYVIVFSDSRAAGSPMHLTIRAADNLIFEESILPERE